MSDHEQRANKRRLPYTLAILGVVFWAIGLLAGTIILISYSSEPGEMAKRIVDWPEDASIAQDTELPTLVMFVHPKCPCTRASLRELERLHADCGEKFAIRFVFYSAPGTRADWSKSDMWGVAERLTTSPILIDHGGDEAKRFAATISGQVALFHVDGQCLYSGGITGARGHEGDNLGRSTIFELVTGKATEAKLLPVFGCAIRDADPSELTDDWQMPLGKPCCTNQTEM